MVIEVNKDIDRYQESVAMGLTARQLIFSIASVEIGRAHVSGYQMSPAFLRLYLNYKYEANIGMTRKPEKRIYQDRRQGQW